MHQIFSPICFAKESMHIYKNPRILDMNEFPPNVRIVHRLQDSGEISPNLEKPNLGSRKDTIVPTTSIRTAKQDDIYGASNIVLPCPGS